MRFVTPIFESIVVKKKNGNSDGTTTSAHSFKPSAAEET